MALSPQFGYWSRVGGGLMGRLTSSLLCGSRAAPHMLCPSQPIVRGAAHPWPLAQCPTKSLVCCPCSPTSAPGLCSLAHLLGSASRLWAKAAKPGRGGGWPGSCWTAQDLPLLATGAGGGLSAMLCTSRAVGPSELGDHPQAPARPAAASFELPTPLWGLYVWLPRWRKL